MSINIDDIASNKKKVCLRCGIIIDKTTDSGWESFVDGHTTQPICVFCNEKGLKEPAIKCQVAVKED